MPLFSDRLKRHSSMQISEEDRLRPRDVIDLNSVYRWDSRVLRGCRNVARGQRTH